MATRGSMGTHTEILMGLPNGKGCIPHKRCWAVSRGDPVGLPWDRWQLIEDPTEKYAFPTVFRGFPEIPTEQTPVGTAGTHRNARGLHEISHGVRRFLARISNRSPWERPDFIGTHGNYVQSSRFSAGYRRNPHMFP